MARSVTLSFPPFTRAIKTLIAINAGIYLFLLWSALGFPALTFFFYRAPLLSADDVVHGRV